MSERTWPIRSYEVPAIIKETCGGLTRWEKGRRVFAHRGHKTNEWTIRPENQLGPTTMCVPRKYLKIKRSDLRKLRISTGSTEK